MRKAWPDAGFTMQDTEFVRETSSVTKKDGSK